MVQEPDAPTTSPRDGSRDLVEWFGQTDHRLRFGWGPNGLRLLAPGAAVVVIVDVLSFSTAVDIALGRKAVVLPYRWHDGTEGDYAQANGAIVAERRPAPGRLSLRPSSLVEVAEGTRLVLPSPNGSALTFAAAEAGASTVMVGCVRNASAVAAVAVDAAGTDGAIAVIAAGERWRGTTGPLRPAIEDLIGAGAVLRSAADRLGGDGPEHLSPEASASVAAFVDARPDLAARLLACGSGRELVTKGHRGDVELAVDLDASPIAPMLDDVALIDGAARSPGDRP